MIPKHILLHGGNCSNKDSELPDRLIAYHCDVAFVVDGVFGRLSYGTDYVVRTGHCVCTGSHIHICRDNWSSIGK